MKRNVPVFVSILSLGMLMLAACTGEGPFDVDTILSQPKKHVKSDTCKTCHLEHYDSWKMTLHSRTTRDAQEDLDALIAAIDEKQIIEDLALMGDRLKIPVDQVFIPGMDDIKYTIGAT